MTGDPDDGEVRRRLLALGTATLGESGAAAMSARVRPVWPGARVAAPAFTVQCADGDNLAIHVGTATAPAGSVLVASIAGPEVRGYWGEVLTTGAEARGVVGLVIDGGVRDVDALESHGFPVFSTTIALRGASKDQPGAVGGSVMVGDVEVTTGDWVVGDVDGVVAIARARLDAVLAAGEARAAKEQELFAALRAGATTVELLGLDAARIRRN
jgi:4-hydroxy-4-methyl-2-oxoglutarate aldolase